MGKKYASQNEMSEERKEEVRKILLEAARDSQIQLISEQDVLAAVEALPEEYGQVLEQLDLLEREGLLVKSRKGRYMPPETYDLFPGIMRGNRRGFGFVTLDDGSRDVYIPKTCMGTAIEGDRVLIKLFSETRGEHRTGSVEKILSRAVTFLTGTYDPGRSYGFVITDGRHMPDVYVAAENSMGAQAGDKVKVKITKYPDSISGMRGEITEIYGKAGDGKAETAAVMERYDVRQIFPESVLAEAAAVSQEVTELQIKGREDLRDRVFITIDGADARDFDDAVRVEKIENENYRLYVSIADVSEYVKEGSPLDKEAFARGTSVYFPDRVCPMLPVELSNGICSLNEGVDRLTLTAEIDIDGGGEIINYRICESVIRSAARMIYTDVSDILENDDEELKEKYRELLPMLYDMRDLAEILGKKRYDEGSIDFDVTESHIRADEDGTVLSLEPAERRTANKIIEEFMLTANKVVAEHCFWMDIPFLYRVHDKPDQMKMEQLKHFAGTLGLTLRGSVSSIHPKSVRDLLLQAEGSDSERVISRVALRSMKKAVYDTSCDGHFGLGFRYYCHFTSPIRRYPDLMIHRIIKETLHGVIEGQRYERLTKLAAAAAEQSSARERAAVDAERAVEKKMKAVYMSQFIGEQFEGIISSVTPGGFFVELENTAEGYVPAESITDDYYIYDENNYRMIGERRRRIFAIGDRVNIVVDKVSLYTDEVDFLLVEGEEERERKRDRRTSKRSESAGASDRSREKRRGGKTERGGSRNAKTERGRSRNAGKDRKRKK